MSRGIASLMGILAFLVALAVMAAAATACEGGGGGGKELTTLSTKLMGESREGEEITILEGTKAKDKATLSGRNASKATGKVSYSVYSEKECKTLIVGAGEVTVSGESVPASGEEELEGGKTYYWQAHYGGDANNAESTSACTEVLNVKAKTSLSLKLAGEGREGEAITISAGSEAEGKATLSGTNSSTAGGKAAYDVYSDNKCEHLVTAAGEVGVSSGKVPASSKEELEGNKTYYWQATYKGDGLHQESKNTCGGPVLNVNPVCTLPYCEPAITPGVEVKIRVVGATNKCTAGPIMKNGAELFLLTAGHCFANEGNITEEVRSVYPNGARPEKRIGATGTATDTNEFDVGEVKIENAEWLLAGGSAPPVLVEWVLGPLAPQVRTVWGAAANRRNEATCFTGAKSGLHCGEILRTGATSPFGVRNLVETTADGEGGDSGAPEFAPGRSTLVQGIFIKGGTITASARGKLTANSTEVTGFPKGEPGDTTCEEITKLKEWWLTVPIEGEGIPANTNVTGCREVVGPPASATLEMSLRATRTSEVQVTYGRKVLGWYEPMSRIEAKYPGQALLVR
jgi:hypothetical protein